MKNSTISWILGIIAVVAIIFGISNMVQNNQLRDDVRNLMIDELPNNDSQELPVSENANNKISGSSEASSSNQTNTTMTSPIAQELAVQAWNINMNPVEGFPPTVEYRALDYTMDNHQGILYEITVLVPALDDSTATIRYQGIAYYQTSWNLDPYANTPDWACHVGRGHQGFSTFPCY